VTEAKSPIQIPDYRLFWLGRFSTVLATSAVAVVLGWQVYDIARSDYGMSRGEAAFQLGIIGLVQFIPLFLLTPVAGLVADRYDRRKVGAFAIGVDLIMTLLLAVFTSEHLLTLPVLFLLASLNGMARVFFGPAIGAIGPNIIPPRLLPKAIGLNSMAMQIGSVAGPALGGLLYAVSPATPYWTATALLTVACVSILRIRPFPKPEINTNRHPLRLIADGFRYVRNEKMLLGCITLDLFAVLLAGATALLPVYARDILQVGPEGLGQMRAAPAVGAAAVGLWLSFRPIERNVGTKMLWSVVVFGLATAIFGLSRQFWLSCSMLVLLGAADMVSMFIRGSLVQLNTPDEMRGRVSSISGLAISASNELGEMQSGLAAALMGATGAVVFGGVGAIFITAIWAWRFPELRNARSFAPQYRKNPGHEHLGQDHKEHEQ